MDIVPRSLTGFVRRNCIVRDARGPDGEFAGGSIFRSPSISTVLSALGSACSSFPLQVTIESNWKMLAIIPVISLCALASSAAELRSGHAQPSDWAIFCLLDGRCETVY